MSLAQTARELMAVGVTGDALCDALDRIEKAAMPIRSKGADRTARWRAKKEASQAVTVTCSDGQSPLSPKESPHTPKEITPNPSSLRSDLARETDFDRLRAAYPRRSGSDPNKPALEKFKIAVRRADPEAIIAGASAYAVHMAGSDPKFIKQLAVWLNQECWTEDWASKPRARAGPQNGSGRDYIAQVALYGEFHDQPASENQLLDITPTPGRSGNGPDDNRALQPAGERPYGRVFGL